MNRFRQMLPFVEWHSFARFLCWNRIRTRNHHECVRFLKKFYRLSASCCRLTCFATCDNYMMLRRKRTNEEARGTPSHRLLTTTGSCLLSSWQYLSACKSTTKWTTRVIKFSVGDRETDRQRDRHTNRQTKQTDRQTDKQTDKQTDT